MQNDVTHAVDAHASASGSTSSTKSATPSSSPPKRFGTKWSRGRHGAARPSRRRLAVVHVPRPQPVTPRTEPVPGPVRRAWPRSAPRSHRAPATATRGPRRRIRRPIRGRASAPRSSPALVERPDRNSGRARRARGPGSRGRCAAGTRRRAGRRPPPAATTLPLVALGLAHVNGERLRSVLDGDGRRDRPSGCGTRPGACGAPPMEPTSAYSPSCSTRIRAILRTIAAVAALHRDDDDGQTRVPQRVGLLATGALVRLDLVADPLRGRRGVLAFDRGHDRRHYGRPLRDAPRDARRYGPNMRFEPTELTDRRAGAAGGGPRVPGVRAAARQVRARPRDGCAPGSGVLQGPGRPRLGRAWRCRRATAARTAAPSIGSWSSRSCCGGARRSATTGSPIARPDR